MSRIRTLGASALALAFGTGAAAAADLATYTPPPEVVYNAAPAWSWTGPYAGAVAGYGWGGADGGGAQRDADGIVGGVFAGYNFQATPNFLIGVETDVMAADLEGDGAGIKVKNNWNGTLRARAGFTLDRFLIYGTGGLAVGGIKAERKGGGAEDDQTDVGWTAGGGIEAALANNVTARLEYRYIDYGEDTYKLSPREDIDFHSSQVLLGVGLKF